VLNRTRMVILSYCWAKNLIGYQNMLTLNDNYTYLLFDCTLAIRSHVSACKLSPRLYLERLGDIFCLLTGYASVMIVDVSDLKSVICIRLSDVSLDIGKVSQNSFTILNLLCKERLKCPLLWKLILFNILQNKIQFVDIYSS
jgi:hypothetical protein